MQNSHQYCLLYQSLSNSLRKIHRDVGKPHFYHATCSNKFYFSESLPFVMTIYYLQIFYTVLCYNGNNALVLKQMSNQGKRNEKKTK